MTEVLHVSSAEIRSAFERWLNQAGARLVILEGLTGTGKTTLAAQPFVLGSSLQSANIDLDDFLRRPVPCATPYVNAIDCPKLYSEIKTAIASSSLVVALGAVVAPIVDPAITSLATNSIKSVYLKRMMRIRPDLWADEDFILDPKYWPPTNFHRSIYEYHAQQRPWLSADLVIERVEEAIPAGPSE